MREDDAYDPVRAFEPRWSLQRVLSLAVVAGYALMGLATKHFSLLWRLALPSIVPMLCIWFPSAMASMTSGVLGWGEASYEPPEGLVRALAWIALLAPVWSLAIAVLLTR